MGKTNIDYTEHFQSSRRNGEGDKDMCQFASILVSRRYALNDEKPFAIKKLLCRC